MKKKPVISEDLIKVFENWRVHNPQYSLEKEIEKNVWTLSDTEIEGYCEKVSEDADKSIFYSKTRGYENLHIITIGKDFPYKEEFIHDITPIYKSLVCSLSGVIEDIEFKVLERKSYTVIGFMNPVIESKFIDR